MSETKWCREYSPSTKGSRCGMHQEKTDGKYGLGAPSRALFYRI